MRSINILLILIALIIAILSCQPKSEYHKLVEKELASGIRNDSIFFGLYLGMSSKDFYTHCWELNKQGLIRQGASNTSVYYQIDDFKYSAGMDFYPQFFEGNIAQMPVIFSYHGWAPWNKHLSVDSLMPEVLGLMEEWHGPGFIEIQNPNPNPLLQNPNAFVKVNGNRRISVYALDDARVRVDYVDLIAEKEIEKVRKTAEKEKGK